MSAIQSADSLQQILSSKQRLSAHVPSKTIFGTLDTLIYNALTAIFVTTKCHRNFAGGLLALVIRESRKKICADRNKALDFLMAAIDTDDPVAAAKFIRQARPNRAFIFQFLFMCDDIRPEYEKAHMLAVFGRGNKRVNEALIQAWKIESFLDATDDRVYAGLQSSHFWLGQALNLREQTLERYYRLFATHVRMSIKNSGQKHSRSDVFNNMVISAFDDAINRFDETQGVITTYIMSWLKDAVLNPRFNPAIGFSYDMPAGHRRALMNNNWMNQGRAEMNVSHDLEVVELEQASGQMSFAQHSFEDASDYDKMRHAFMSISHLLPVQMALMAGNVPWEG